METTKDPDLSAQAGRKAQLEKALLSKEQQTALTRIKRYTDFNDLATQSGPKPPRPGRGGTPDKGSSRHTNSNRNSGAHGTP